MDAEACLQEESCFRLASPPPSPLQAAHVPVVLRHGFVHMPTDEEEDSGSPSRRRRSFSAEPRPTVETDSMVSSGYVSAYHFAAKPPLSPSSCGVSAGIGADGLKTPTRAPMSLLDLATPPPPLPPDSSKRFQAPSTEAASTNVGELKDSGTNSGDCDIATETPLPSPGRAMAPEAAVICPGACASATDWKPESPMRADAPAFVPGGRGWLEAPVFVPRLDAPTFVPSSVQVVRSELAVADATWMRLPPEPPSQPPVLPFTAPSSGPSFGTSHSQQVERQPLGYSSETRATSSWAPFAPADFSRMAPSGARHQIANEHRHGNNAIVGRGGDNYAAAPSRPSQPHDGRHHSHSEGLGGCGSDAYRGSAATSPPIYSPVQAATAQPAQSWPRHAGANRHKPAAVGLAADAREIDVREVQTSSGMIAARGSHSKKRYGDRSGSGSSAKVWVPKA
jgi:hypothetical protein